MGEHSRLDFGDSSPENSLMHSADTAVADPPEKTDPETRKPDFSGWASKYGIQCADGRTIQEGAFAHQDGVRLPLVWQHGHSSIENILGFVDIVHKDEGPYCYGYFNETVNGQNAKLAVEHGDIDKLSIYANGLIEKFKKVAHGVLREVSLVLAGANPGALIDNLEIVHGDGEVEIHVDEAVIHTGLLLEHGDETEETPEVEHAATERTEETTEVAIDDPHFDAVYDAMSDEQKTIVHYAVGRALESVETDTTPDNKTDPSDPEKVITHQEEDPNEMTNVFETGRGRTSELEKKVLSHDAMLEIGSDAKKVGSYKEAVEKYAFAHGIENIDVLFPEARNITDTPEWDKRRTEWVGEVLSTVNKRPFSRIKSTVAHITHAEARARGYIKGTLKKDEYFGLTRRVTTPATVYKKQRLDRDDILDITDFDVVIWLKGEMRLMLEEEIARAILIGDGRLVDDEDKIKDPAGSNEGQGIRSILNDHDLYAATFFIDVDGDLKKTDVVDQVLMSMINYKGSGLPTFYATQGTITQMMLSRDDMGRRYYRTASDLAAELGVSKCVAVEPMEEEEGLVGIIVNLQDYTIGADRGGETSMFDDFDIDYNQYKYLIETRVSGALTKIRSAIIIRQADAGTTIVNPAAPTFDPETSEITIVNTAGVTYKRNDTNATVTNAGSPYAVDEGVDLTIYAVANPGSVLANNIKDEWTFRGTQGAAS